MVSTGAGLPADTLVSWDRRVARRAGGAVLLGGSPWRLARVSVAARDFVTRLAGAGPEGLLPRGATERAVADHLVDRGMAHPLPAARAAAGVTVVVPAFDRADLLDACLSTLRGGDVVVVDDASHDAAAIVRVAAAHGARLVRHPVNRGPAAARNTGLLAVGTLLVAFVDSDCRVPTDWLDVLVPLFDDPRVGAVAPRVRSDPGPDTGADPAPAASVASLLTRHEAARSALDMGPHRELVRPGARLGFLPSAALVVRRDALAAAGFDEAMRVGEDVDLVWRLADQGWHVRYEPSVTVTHAARLRPVAWARRRYEYGTSAADLDRRHPGRLAPARVSGWALAALALVVAGRPVLAGGLLAGAASLLTRQVAHVEAGPAARWSLAVQVVAQGAVADAASVGHALRREWWPLGWLALATATRSRLARSAVAAMLVPLALEWVRTRPDVDPLRDGILRLVEDAAYGSGVITSAVRGRRPRPVLPVITLPWSGHGRATGRSR